MRRRPRRFQLANTHTSHYNKPTLSNRSKRVEFLVHVCTRTSEQRIRAICLSSEECRYWGIPAATEERNKLTQRSPSEGRERTGRREKEEFSTRRKRVSISHFHRDRLQVLRVLRGHIRVGTTERARLRALRSLFFVVSDSDRIFRPSKRTFHRTPLRNGSTQVFS